MSKLKWELQTDKSKLWTKLFKLKYPDPNKNYKRTSYIFKSLSNNQFLFNQNISYLVRNGEDINLWLQPWLNNNTLRYQIAGPLPKNETQKNVSNIIIAIGNEYNWYLNSIPFNLPDNISDQIKIVALPFPVKFPN